MSTSETLLRELVSEMRAQQRELIVALRTLPREIAAEVAAELAVLGQRPSARRSLTRDVRDRAAALLACIWRAMGAAEPAWTCVEIIDYALNADPQLREALEAALRAPLSRDCARSLGRALARIEGVELGGLVLRRVGDDRDGAIWAVNVTLKPARNPQTRIDV